MKGKCRSSLTSLKKFKQFLVLRILIWKHTWTFSEPHDITPSFTALNFLFLLHFPLRILIYLHNISHVISMTLVLIFAFFLLLCSSSFWLQLIFPYTVLLISHQYLSLYSSYLRQPSRSYDGLYWSIIFAFWRHFPPAYHALTGFLLGVGHYTGRDQQLLQDASWCLVESSVGSYRTSGLLCFLMSRKKVGSNWKKLRFWSENKLELNKYTKQRRI